MTRYSFDLSTVAFTDKTGIKTVLYRLVSHFPVRNQVGTRLFWVMPHWSKDSKRVDLLGPPPPSDRKLLLLHPDNYVALVDMAIDNKVTLMEWSIEHGKKESDGSQGVEASTNSG